MSVADEADRGVPRQQECGQAGRTMKERRHRVEKVCSERWAESSTGCCLRIRCVAVSEGDDDAAVGQVADDAVGAWKLRREGDDPHAAVLEPTSHFDEISRG